MVLFVEIRFLLSWVKFYYVIIFQITNGKPFPYVERIYHLCDFRKKRLTVIYLVTLIRRPLILYVPGASPMMRDETLTASVVPLSSSSAKSVSSFPSLVLAFWLVEISR